ncbi:hypothetical protein [Nitrososphaeria virus YSH_1032793]|uniref:Uncharacterized protein n=1 Tax=Nitrososphaeria virus YSH_1032793 TaxID=3071320 RepID=A0A976YDR4_9CAUD|nr:hypothetical protein QKV91_gp09 [Yangshan Harbor Nitrososphaeria virus]UVF62213.1 hypothetical protein [Nitrososphaeria virus YSH_1032793]
MNPAEVRIERDQIAFLYFDKRCFGCRKKFGRRFAFHHRRYLNGEKIILKRLSKDPVKYWIYVKTTIVIDPSRFFCLCNTCHSRIDNFRTGLSRIKKSTLRRLLLVLFMTEK